MNRWPTSEHFYAAQDDFRRYIRDEVNPARVQAGLSEIRDDEARECFRIIYQFLDRWMGTASQPIWQVRPLASLRRFIDPPAFRYDVQEVE